MNNKIICPICKSTETRKVGFAYTRTGKKQVYGCRACGRTWRVVK